MGTQEQLYDLKGGYNEIFTAIANTLNLEKITYTIE